jgi:hypothetical protein
LETRLSQPKQQLDLNVILNAEFQYIAQTAFQANEDRARVSNYYFVTTVAAVAAIVGSKIEGAFTSGVYLGFSVLFAVLSVVGLITVLQLARLRTAWTESVKAMNFIKQYYVDNIHDLNTEQAFAWTMNSIPPINKRKSIAFLLAVSIMIVDAVTFTTSSVYLGLALGARPLNYDWLIIGVIAGSFFFLVQFLWYVNWLK